MLYEKPILDVIRLDRTDIITLSVEPGGSGPENDGDGQWS